MKKYLSILIILIVISPSITLAAWWNPLSWFNNWSIFHKEDKTQVLEGRIKELEDKLNNVATSTNNPLTTATSTATTTVKINPIVIKPKIQSSTIVKVESSKPTTKTFTLQNGTVVDEFGNIVSGKVQDEVIVSNTSKTYTDQQISNLFNSSVVKIETDAGSGSGFIYDKNGNILTANHVVKGFNNVKVRLMTNESFEGVVVWSNEYDDIAVVNIGKVGAPSMLLGDSDSLQIGDEMIVLGYPLGLDGMVLSKGILNSKQKGSNYTFLGTDANTQPGSSGGPWLSRKGEVVGLHVMGIGPQIQGIKVNQGLNFSVPINYIKAKIPYDLKSSYTFSSQSTSSNFPPGSSINLKKSIQYSVDYNPNLSCNELGLYAIDLEICNLYKNHKSEYTWVVIED